MYSSVNTRVVVFLLAAINFANVMDFMVMMPLGPQIKRVFQLSPSEWSAIVASYTFAAFASGVVSMFYIDKFDRKTVLQATFLGFCVATFYCGMAPTHLQLMIARSLAGIFGGVLGAVSLTIVGDLVPFEQRGKAMGTVMAGFSAAAALGVPFGLHFGTLYSWHVPFLALAVISVIISVLIQIYLPSMKAHLLLEKKSSTLATIKKVFTSTNKLKGFVYMVFLILGQFSIIPFLSPYLVANVGFKEEELKYIYLLGGLFTVFTGPFIGKLSDKIGNAKVFVILMIVSLIPTLVISHLTSVSIYLVLLFTTLFFVFAGGRMIPAMAIVTATAEPEVRGVFMGIRSSIQQLAAGLAAMVAGGIMVENPDHTYAHYNWVGYFAVTCCLVSWFMVNKIETKY